MKNVWGFCKVFENEHRRMLLAEIYRILDGGCNVGYLFDCMHGVLELPAVSQYLNWVADSVAETATSVKISRKFAAKSVQRLSFSHPVYLKQIEQLGLLRRERCGKYVNYLDAMREDDADVRKIAHLYRNILRTNEACDDRGMFRALMNAFRARVCHYLLEGGSGEKEDICEKFQHVSKHLV